MSNTNWSFELTYWGTTGSFPRAFTPYDVTHRVVRTIRQLHEMGKLDEICAETQTDDELLGRIAALVPFEQRSVNGGNTTCLEIRTPDSLFLVDAGSGLHPWARQVQLKWNQPDYTGRRTGHVLITHAHLDHTCALAFADVFFDERNEFAIWATAQTIDQLRSVLASDQCDRNLLAPVSWQQLAGIRHWNVLPSSGELEIEGTRISSLPLNHPGTSLAFGFERNGKRIVVATDHEQAEAPDPPLAHFARGADLLYLDSQYLQCEYEGQRGVGTTAPRVRQGWGHSTVEASVATAAAAGVLELHLGHHDPHRADAELDEIEQYAREYARRYAARLGSNSVCRVRLAREGDRWTF
jgi:phosphoribosyl 1,2-cyclic phosphodiesterase